MCQIFIRILCIRQGDLIQRRLLARNNFHQRLRAVQQRAAEFGETHVPPARDDVISQAHDVLLIDLMADLGSPQHDLDAGALLLQQTHHLAGLGHVPDVDAEADDLRVAWHGLSKRRQQRVHNVLRHARYGELPQNGLRLQVTHVRQ